MRRLLMRGALGLLLAAPAAGQDQGQGLGLDLNAPEPEKKPEEKKEEKAPEPPPPPVETKTPVQAEQPAPELTEQNVTLQDRVKAVEQRSVLKYHRLEISPAVGASVNDPFYTKYALGLSAQFYAHDSLGLGLRGMYFLTYATWNVPEAKRDLVATLPASKPVGAVMADVQWTPFYGKVAVYNTITQFDLFVVGGLGVVASETTFGNPSLGPHFGSDLGLGIRALVGDFLAVHLTYLDTLYSDQPAGAITSRSTTANLGVVQLGVSLFIPPRFDYEVH